jgi:hypothetical protein
VQLAVLRFVKKRFEFNVLCIVKELKFSGQFHQKQYLESQSLLLDQLINDQQPYHLTQLNVEILEILYGINMVD